MSKHFDSMRIMMMVKEDIVNDDIRQNLLV